MMHLKFKILDVVLEVLGESEMCEAIAEGFECMLFSQSECNVSDYRLTTVMKRHNQLFHDIPEWAVADLDIELLDGDGKHTQHVISKNRLFVYTRAKDGSVGVFCSNDLKNFQMTVYRRTSSLGLSRIRNVFIPMLLRSIGESCGYLLFHCAAVADAAGNVAVFLAHAGTGKTTISLALVKCGYKLLSDDLAYIGGEDGVNVYGILEKVNFTKWTSEQFAECAQYFREKGVTLAKRKQSVDIQNIYGNSVVAEHGRVTMVFVLKNDHHSPLHVNQISTFAFLSQMRDSQILPLTMHGGQILLDIVSRVNAYELYTGSDPFKTAEWIECNWNTLFHNSSSALLGV